jgi:hypothetical protein
MPKLSFILLKMKVKRNMYVKNSVIHNISYAEFIKKTPSGNYRSCSFLDNGSYFVKCSANIPYPLISNKCQNLWYLNRVPKS